MDALVRAALVKVNEAVGETDKCVTASHLKVLIVKAINTVDALKSALKAL